MQIQQIIVALLATHAGALSLPNHDSGARKSQIESCDAPVLLDAKTNIWNKYKLHPNRIYREKVEAAIPLINDTFLQARAKRVLNAGTFVWIDGVDQISLIEQTVQDVPCDHVVGIVISGLPFKQCTASNEPPKHETYDYQKDYIEPIVKKLKSYPNNAFALIIEPGVVGNFVINTNSNVTTLPNADPSRNCTHVAASYRKNVPQALSALSLPNTILYLDAGHAGTFGWGKYRAQGAAELLNTWKAAGTPSQFRGLSLNVMSYNSWDLYPGERFRNEDSCYDTPSNNPARNEKLYITILEREFKKLNSTMPFYSIVDTSRSGVQGIREFWGDWCNIEMAGFGLMPGTSTNDVQADAFVWTKWGGVSDGTSDPANSDFDSNCGKVTAHKPMPAKGEWSQTYFESLVNDWRGYVRRAEWSEKNKVARCG
ncbi:glycoside hydrolase family 6 protein [Aaosphaeria arxii CBS 175.79]|uniref:Glucanase n=1 Tax=Aaosphaeria arxii CBS 175.79 TaxID=1450172 RepID=A0A6A5XL97_9PLEO|nr:glycoside hydrolase family 6 protein [Aaosphaeria arxii CBS 175.79]KAF2013619.1 glycoside hydrolase family 6 protein [Aaosphaeria arxii CBS 175.79]